MNILTQLLENTSESPISSVDDFKFSMRIYCELAPRIETIKNDLKKANLPVEKMLSAKNFGLALQLQFKIKSPYSEKQFYTLIDQVHSIVSRHNKTVPLNYQSVLKTSSIWVDAVPSGLIEAPGSLVQISPANNTFITLKDIHKKIVCGELNLNNVQLIAGNVLGLLRVKTDKPIVTPRYVHCPWLDIVEKYLQTKDKDVYACQEELMDNDLHQFAEL